MIAQVMVGQGLGSWQWVLPLVGGGGAREPEKWQGHATVRVTVPSWTGWIVEGGEHVLKGRAALWWPRCVGIVQRWVSRIGIELPCPLVRLVHHVDWEFAVMCRKSSSFENVDKQGHNVRDVQSVENLNDGTTAGSHIRVLRAMDRAASGSGNLTRTRNSRAPLVRQSAQMAVELE